MKNKKVAMPLEVGTISTSLILATIQAYKEGCRNALRSRDNFNRERGISIRNCQKVAMPLEVGTIST